jgi:multidrug efflux pump subunit AcrA (membrane-fusion protein)
MHKRFNTWRLLAGAVLIGLSTTACAQLSPASIIPRLTGTDTQQPLPDTTDSTATLSGQTAVNATPATAISPLASNQAAVTRGSIQETFTSIGRVAGSGDTDVTFPSTGKIDALAVKVGDKVEVGQLLLQTDSAQIQKDLTAARSRLENDAARVQQAMDQSASQTHAQQADAAKRAADEAVRRQQEVSDAQTALRRAQDTMDKVMAGPSTTDVRTAQAALTNAQAQLVKVTNDRDTLYKGANPADVRAAERSLAAAQTDLDKAQAAFDALNRGPDPNAVAAAERDVARAQTALQVAQATKVDNVNVTQTQRDALVANSKLNVQDAQDKLNALKQPPAASDVAIAQRNLQVAQQAVAVDRQTLDAVKKGPDQATLDAADQAVDNQQTVVDNSQDRLDELMSHPTPQEVRDAQDRVSTAQKDLSNAQRPNSTTAVVDDGSTEFNIQLLQKTTAQDQADVDSLQKQLEATHLMAPTAGTVTAVMVHAGDAIDPTHPVMTLSQGGAPVVNVDLTEQDVAKVKVGQKAHIVLDGQTTTPIDATLIAVVANTTAGIGRTATLQVNWPKTPPNIGATAQVGIIIQTKDDVLLVPKKAVRSAGARRFVQYMNGSSRKVANVEVGIVSDDMAEILSGLTVGQVVVVGP